MPELTPHGRAVVEAAGKVETDLGALEELVANLGRGVEQTLEIVVDLLFPTPSLVTFAKDFASEHPGVRLVLYTEILSAVTAHVREKRAAWGIALEDADLGDLDRKAIADVRLVPVAAPTHPLAQRQGSIDAATLADAVQIVLGEHRPEGERTPNDDQGVFSPRTRTWRVVDLGTKQALIAGGLGWGHMPEHVVRDDLRAGRLVELRLDAWGGEAPRRSLVLVWRRHAVMGPSRVGPRSTSRACAGAPSSPGPITPGDSRHHAGRSVRPRVWRLH